MIKQYRCKKHGILHPYDRLCWFRQDGAKRWCRFCIDELMDKFCGTIIETKEESENDV
jgi:hypothetical protein